MTIIEAKQELIKRGYLGCELSEQGGCRVTVEMPKPRALLRVEADTWEDVLSYLPGRATDAVLG